MVNFLAEADLLGIALIHEALLLVEQFLLKLLLTNLLEFDLSCKLLFNALLAMLTCLVTCLLVMLVLAEQSLVLFLLPCDPVVGLTVFVTLLL